MKVSVLMPVFREGDQIEGALQSVLTQSFKDIEILVGVNEVTDVDTANLPVTKYTAPLCQTILECEQEIRKILLQHAQGEYVIFLDPMDRFTDPDKLVKQVQALEEESREDCDACAHEVLLHVNGQDKEQNGYKRMFKVRNSVYLSHGFRFDESSVLMRNVFADDSEKDMDTYCFSHHLILYRALKKGKLHYEPEIMSEAYRPRKSGMELHVRGMVELDAECRVNKRFKDDSLMRHCSDKEYIKSHPEELSASWTEAYLAYAKKRSYKNAIDWIGYDKTSAVKKASMMSQLYFDKMNVKQNKHKVNKTTDLIKSEPQQEEEITEEME